jgi:D-glycero-D-manno-heptose 1,7-bisphosphate phosphatase
VPGVLEARASWHRWACAGGGDQPVGHRPRLYSLQDFERLTDWMRDQFAAAGAPIAGVYYCPHHPTDAVGADRRECDCRKPAPGLLLQAQRELDLDLDARCCSATSARTWRRRRRPGCPSASCSA